MKILVTGGSGFIGQHLLPELLEREHTVFSLERYVTGRYVLGGRRRVITAFGDLRDYSAVKQIVKQIQPEIVVHLAAISPVSYSYEHPQEVMETNFLGTINLAEACLREIPHFRHFLLAGTSEEYGDNGVNPKNEDSPLQPNSPYAVSKVAASRYLQYLGAAYNFPFTVLRNFNTYGRKDNTHFVVERAVFQMLTQETVSLGDPEPIRDLLYVQDHVNAYLTCLDNAKAKSGTFNFCTGSGISILDLANKLARITGFKGDIIWNALPRRPSDIKILMGSNEKARRILNWTPKFSLDQGLELTADHWKGTLQRESTLNEDRVKPWEREAVMPGSQA